MIKVGPLFLLIFFYGACSLPDNGKLPTPPDLKVKRDDRELYLQQGLWWYKGRPLSGYILEEQTDQLVIYQLPVIEGLANGRAVGFYENGHKMLERFFVNGKQEGECRQWWRNGQCKYLLFYRDNKYEGTQKAFFENGRLREEANYLAGKPEGLQRAWDENGQLASNYTIRNNQLYGIITVQSCIPGAAH
jgi:antitoxin component YwqK of YwqJK toxin-antitoxin module